MISIYLLPFILQLASWHWFTKSHSRCFTWAEHLSNSQTGSDVAKYKVFPALLFVEACMAQTFSRWKIYLAFSHSSNVLTIIWRIKKELNSINQSLCTVIVCPGHVNLEGWLCPKPLGYFHIGYYTGWRLLYRLFSGLLSSIGSIFPTEWDFWETNKKLKSCDFHLILFWLCQQFC